MITREKAIVIFSILLLVILSVWQFFIISELKRESYFDDTAAQRIYDHGYKDGLKEGIILGIKSMNCQLEELIKDIINDPAEYCYDKIIGKFLQEQTKHA